jgi:hypothetical protein
MKLTPEAFENLARAMAECCNGGSWNTHYTEDQKDVWRNRATLVAEKEQSK